MANISLSNITNDLCQDKCGHCNILLSNNQINKIRIEAFLDIIRYLLMTIQNPIQSIAKDADTNESNPSKNMIEILDASSVLISCNESVKYTTKYIIHDNDYNMDYIQDIKMQESSEIIMSLKTYLSYNYTISQDDKTKDILKHFIGKDMTNSDYQSISTIIELINKILPNT